MAQSRLRRSSEDIVSKLDLRPIIKSLKRQRILGQDKLDQAEELYRIFLRLRRMYPKTLLIPTPLADVVWHEHILHTKKYEKDCLKLFGKFLHHSPAALLGPRTIRKAYLKTVFLVRKHYLHLKAENNV